MEQTARENTEYRICVLGNFSGRNAGDNAILGCLMDDIAARYSNVRFVVPTFNPDYVRRHFSRHVVEPVSLLPWALSIKIFGLPVFRAVLSADLVLVTDNLLFDMKLFNPLFNYLSTLSLCLPLAKRRGIPVVLYNMSLGPIRTPMGKRLFERVIKSCKLIILRDQQSKALLDRLNIAHDRIEFGADCAINARPSPPERLQTMIGENGLFRNPKGTFGFNINAYLDAYIRGDETRLDMPQFTRLIGEAVDRLIEVTGMDALFFVTQVMDMKVTAEAVSHVRQHERVKIISNKDYTYEDITALLAEVEFLVAMRTHAIILATSVYTPVVGIISYPKTAGYLSTIEQDRWTIKFEDLTCERLVELALQVYEQRAQIQAAMKPAVQREKARARQSADLLVPYLLGERAEAAR